MKIRLIKLILFLLPLAAAAQSVVRVDTTVAMSDGAVLDAVYVYPVTAPPAAGYPAILLIHGFGGSKDVNGALSWARLGYLGVAYSVRGQGNSQGEFDFFTSPRIRGDLQEMIDFTKRMPRVNPERVGVTGGSQGGIHAWMAAAYHMGARAVISVVANGRFEEDFANNNAFNYIFSLTMQYASVHFTPFVTDTVIPALKSDDFAFIRSQLEHYSTKDLETQVSTPAFILVSYFDQFFDPRAALEQFARIPGPKKILVYPGAHGAPTDPSHFLLANLMAERWFAYWLKDETAGNSIADPDSAVVMLDQVTKGAKTYSLADSVYWLHPDPSSPKPQTALRLYLDAGKLCSSQPAAAGAATVPFISGLGSTDLVLRSDPLPRDLLLSGAAGSAAFTVNSPAAKYQVNLLLFDFDPATNTYLQLTRGHAMVRNNTAGAREELRFTLNAIYHTLKAGHIVEARIKGGIGLMPGSEDFGNAVVPPNVSGTDTLFTGGATASYFELNLLPSSTSPVQKPTSPAGMALGNYPNPFGPGSIGASGGTTFRFAIPGGTTRLELFDRLGRKVTTLVDADLAAGEHETTFTAGALPGGVYHAVLTNGTNRMVKNIVCVR